MSTAITVLYYVAMAWLLVFTLLVLAILIAFVWAVIDVACMIWAGRKWRNQ